MPEQHLLQQVRKSIRAFPRHEPTHWLRTTAESAALRLAALPGHYRAGVSVIVPLVPIWPPPGPDRPAPVHLCSRCGDSAAERTPGAFRQCGFAATSQHHPGVLLKFAFELCSECATKEFG